MYNIKYEPLNGLFVNKRGNSSFTKSYCDCNKGDYEVFTGTTIGSFAFIDTYEYDCENLTYTTDGEYAGTVSVIKGKHNIGGHRAILFPQLRNIYLDYFKYVLQPLFFSQKRSNCVPTVTWSLIKDLRIPVPCIENGELDFNAQVELANKFELISNKLMVLKENREVLAKLNVEFDMSKYNYKTFRVDSLFDLNKSTTNGSKFTLDFVKKNPGSIPVYGAAKFEDKIGYGYVKDNAVIIEKKGTQNTFTKVKYFENCLTYNIDGQGGCGYIFYRKGRFSLSEKVKPLIIFDKYKPFLDPEYLKYSMQPMFLSRVRGRKITKEIVGEIEIDIPIDSDGRIDLTTQKEIAQKYKKVDAIKNALISKINDILDTDVDVGIGC